MSGWNEKKWRALSHNVWGVEARGYDSTGKLVYRKVFAPHEDVKMVFRTGVSRIETRAVYFDADGRPDWTLVKEELHPFGVAAVSFKNGASSSRWVSGGEYLLEAFERGFPQPWDPQPIDGEWPPMPRRGLCRFERRAA